jgi:hypothetical protein
MEWRDEIVEEVRAAREAYASRFHYDLDAMFADLKAKERQHPELLTDSTPAHRLKSSDQKPDNRTSAPRRLD